MLVAAVFSCCDRPPPLYPPSVAGRVLPNDSGRGSSNGPQKAGLDPLEVLPWTTGVLRVRFAFTFCDAA